MMSNNTFPEPEPDSACKDLELHELLQKQILLDIELPGLLAVPLAPLDGLLAALLAPLDGLLVAVAGLLLDVAGLLVDVAGLLVDVAGLLVDVAGLLMTGWLSSSISMSSSMSDMVTASYWGSVKTGIVWDAATAALVCNLHEYKKKFEFLPVILLLLLLLFCEILEAATASVGSIVAATGSSL